MAKILDRYSIDHVAHHTVLEFDRVTFFFYKTNIFACIEIRECHCSVYDLSYYLFKISFSYELHGLSEGSALAC